VGLAGAIIGRFVDAVWEHANTAVDAASFRRSVVEQIGSVIGLDTAVVVPFAGPPEESTVRGAVSVGFDPALFARYLEKRHAYYASMAPLIRAISAHGAVNAFEPFGSRLSRVPAYAEVLGPGGIKSCLSGAIAFRGRPSGVLTVSRHGRGPGFGARELEHLRALLPIVGMADAALAARVEEPANDFTAPLTRREREIVALLSLGLQNKEIAASLGTSANTVRNQTIAIYQKLGVSGRVELLVRLRVAPGRLLDR
jgi:DNA-binding CsgD family transcriptional regulator